MRPRAYEGKEPYIFVSYAHKDDDQVFEILSTLGEKGYRVWYDEGITPGSEWTEDIARHLDDSAMVIAFITPASMASKNCRREINYALFKEKPFLSVILEKTEMSPGMMMQLSVQQSILRYDYTSWESFIDKILLCPEIAPCKAPEPVKKPLEEPDKKTTVEEPEAINPTGGTEQNGLKAQKPKKKLPLIPVLVGIACVIAVFFALTIMGSFKTSWGEEFKSDTTRVDNYGRSFTQSDLTRIAGLKKLETILLIECDFSNCDFSNIKLASDSINNLRIDNCTGINDFSFLKGKKIGHVTLNGCDSFSDLSLLDIPSLHTLHLDGTAVTDLSVLKGSKISELSFRNTEVSDISFAAEMPSLNEIAGSGSKVTSLAALADLENLQRIEFSGCSISEFPEYLEALRLARVDLSGCGLTDVGFLSNCTLLNTLYLSDNPLLQDLGELLENNKGALKNLSLSRTGIGAEKLKELVPCTKLETLSVSGIPMDDLSFVSKMSNLSSLTAENCGITDISALAGLRKLELIRLAFNNIEDVGPLKQSLKSAYNPIVDLSFNRLTSAEYLPDNSYEALLLHGNDERIGPTLHVGVGTTFISLPWGDGLLENGKLDKLYGQIYLVDCPKVQQVKASGRNSSCRFVTEQELMTALYNKEVYLRKDINYDYPYEVYQNR